MGAHVTSRPKFLTCVYLRLRLARAAGFYLKAVLLLGIMVLTRTSRSRFKQSKISSVSGCFVIFFLGGGGRGDFWVYLGKMNSFSQRISKIFGNGKFGRFDVVL